MAGYFVSVGGKVYHPTADVESTKAAVVAAARAGGDFVSVASRGRVVDVLVSPGLCVVVEELVEPQDIGAAGAVGIETVVPFHDSFEDWGI